MNVLSKNILRQHLNSPCSRIDVIREKCTGKRVLDLGCVCHDLDNVTSERWLHRAIKDVALSVLGVDYLDGAVREMQLRGYDAILADINKPIDINRRFDVIVVGNLIEHLSSFDGLFENLRNLLDPGGIVLISTANPFFFDQYFYSALKNDIIINPEHTCWIDPVALDQLSRRFGFVTTEVRWIRESFELSSIILNDEGRELDIFTGKWRFLSPPTLSEKIVGRSLVALYRIFPRDKSGGTRLTSGRYGSQLYRYAYLRLCSRLFGLWWLGRRVFIPTSPINRYELFFSILSIEGNASG